MWRKFSPETSLIFYFILNIWPLELNMVMVLVMPQKIMSFSISLFACALKTFTALSQWGWLRQTFRVPWLQGEGGKNKGAGIGGAWKRNILIEIKTGMAPRNCAQYRVELQRPGNGIGPALYKVGLGEGLRVRVQSRTGIRNMQNNVANNNQLGERTGTT